MEVIASAPGKVFVVGEYAVIGGGPAVVATVTRRLRARVRARPGNGDLVVRAGDHVLRCPLTTERVADLPEEGRFVAAAALVSARVLGLAGIDLEIATESDLDRGPGKSGLGGSAAATAATVCAVYGLAAGRRGGGDDEQARVAAAVYAHRLVQGGGSGGDVIAAMVGGLVWMEDLDGRDAPRDVAACATRVEAAPRFVFERLELPPGLALEVVSCRRPCATAPRAARFAARLRAAGTPAGEGVRAWAAGMEAAASSFRDGCRHGDADLVQRSVARAATLLSRLGAVAAIPVYTPELRRACALARGPARGAAKPSGAGGGDCAIALVADGERTYLRERWREAGLEPLAVDLDRAGAWREVTT